MFGSFDFWVKTISIIIRISSAYKVMNDERLYFRNVFQSDGHYFQGVGRQVFM